MNNEFVIAVHALVYLNYTQETVASDRLAENVCTNPVCIRRVMGKLKRAGLIETKEGALGGYKISESGSKCTLQKVGETLETEYIKASWHSGNPDKDCMICSKMAGIMDNVVEDMNHLCREYLENITISDIEHRIFEENNI